MGRVRRLVMGWSLFRGRCVVVLALTVAGMAVSASSAAGMDFTWTGASSGSSWADGDNWGGAAPAGAVGELTFPELTQAACARPLSGSETCYVGTDDLGSLEVDGLSIDPADGYTLSAGGAGDGITLGAGGLTAVTPQDSTGTSPSSLNVPITLSAPQTWTIDGTNAGAQLDVGAGISSVSSDALNLKLTNFADLGLNGSDDVGPIAIAGTGPSGDTSEVQLLGGDLNGTDGQAISLSDAGLVNTAPETIGPLSASDGFVGVGNGDPDNEDLTVNGGMTLDPQSTLELFVNLPGTTSPAEYTSLTASGNIDLDGAALELVQGHDSSYSCVSLNPGDVYTIVSTTGGTLSGTFKDLPDGAVVPFGADCGGQPGPWTAIIHYTATAVTATIATIPSNVDQPAITGTAEQGQTLSASTGTWTQDPTSYQYQWQYCPPNSGCLPIQGATDPTYTLTSADIGDQIEVRVAATNASGTGGPTTSQMTQQVLSLAPASAVPPSISGWPSVGQTVTATGGSWTNSPTSISYQWLSCSGWMGFSCVPIQGATSQSYTVTSADLGTGLEIDETATNAYGSGGVISLPMGVAPAATTSDVATSLRQALVPRGAPSKISAIVKANGYTTTFLPSEAGRLNMSWYLTPSRSDRTAKSHTRPSPVLIATGQLRIDRPGLARITLRLTKAGAKLLKRSTIARLTARGTFKPDHRTAVRETRTLKLR